jgi:putative transposase
VSALARGGADPLALERPLYRALFRDRLDPGSVEALRGATNGGWALGDRRFQRAIAQAVGRRAAPLPKGRKPKADKYRRRPDLF